MPCYIRYSNSECKVVETEWTLTNHLPAIDNLCVVEMEVSGVELQHMTQLLKGLIRPPQRDKVRWEGDLARVIWGLVGGRR